MNCVNEKFVWLGFVLLVFQFQANSQERPQQTILPGRYDEHRFFVEPVTEKGEKISFFTDTGGGLFLYKDVAERLKLVEAGAEKDAAIALPKFKAGLSIPEPLGSEGKLFVFEKNKGNSPFGNFEGMLGQQWFADRIWTFDYPGKRLILWSKTPAVIGKKSPHSVKLGFKADANGKRILSFPRIQIEIDAEILEMLFDTGATTFLTKEALDAIRDGGSSERATNFITNSVFEKWRKKHPEWRVIEKAETGTGEAMIEVSNIKIAGYTVKSAWFTRRADRNFHEYMTQFMDKKIEGAVGGSVLRHFRITVDYPQATAVFEKK